MAYLTTSEFKDICAIAPSDIDQLETKYPGFTQKTLDLVSSKVDARLRKRYAAPFAAPYPECIQDWVARISCIPILLRIGIVPTDEQFVALKDDAELAKKELSEAADGNAGLWDLPLRQDTTTTGLSQDTPLMLTSAGPYAWIDDQRVEVYGS